jgi:cobalamin synthase
MLLVVVVSIVVSVLSDAHCKKRIYGANGDNKTAGNCEQL